ncbi:enoyl-CoA hydratase/isomerase family protein [Bradyrhizobium sp. DASA03007]|uniref:enoyl-CoA hydratase/isomerase family protein n=1 Tax=Bradyrhizobium sp. SPXBL-03 TaxID=3395913 RepID=UPI003F7022E2
MIVDRNGPVTTLILNRPKVHNALDRELSAELNAAVKQVAFDRECRVLVLKGAGNTFCAGDDIKEFNEWTPEEGPWQVKLYQETSNLIDNMWAITIAAVDGVCTGGGLELTLVCDFVVATDRSRWGMPEINWDITPGWGGTNRLQKFAGRRKTKEWNLIGGLFDAKTAERYDLVNRLTTPEKLDADVQALVDVMLEKAPTAVRCTKHFLNASADATTSIGLAFEGAPPRLHLAQSKGIREFVHRDTRDTRRRLANALWKG